MCHLDTGNELHNCLSSAFHSHDHCRSAYRVSSNLHTSSSALDKTGVKVGQKCVCVCVCGHETIIFDIHMTLSRLTAVFLFCIIIILSLFPWFLSLNVLVSVACYSRLTHVPNKPDQSEPTAHPGLSVHVVFIYVVFLYSVFLCC